MNRLRLLWRLLTGGHDPVLQDHGRRITALEVRTDKLERLQESREAFRRVADGSGK